MIIVISEQKREKFSKDIELALKLMRIATKRIVKWPRKDEWVKG